MQSFHHDPGGTYCVSEQGSEPKTVSERQLWFPKDPIATLWSGLGRTHKGIWGWSSDGRASFLPSACQHCAIPWWLHLPDSAAGHATHLSWGHPESEFGFLHGAGTMQYWVDSYCTSLLPVTEWRPQWNTQSIIIFFSQWGSWCAL